MNVQRSAWVQAQTLRATSTFIKASSLLLANHCPRLASEDHSGWHISGLTCEPSQKI
jgi:hypothetical protein